MMMENVIVTAISRETNVLNVMLNITIGLLVKVSGSNTEISDGKPGSGFENMGFGFRF